jgi:hypothetical protein
VTAIRPRFLPLHGEASRSRPHASRAPSIPADTLGVTVPRGLKLTPRGGEALHGCQKVVTLGSSKSDKSCPGVIQSGSVVIMGEQRSDRPGFAFAVCADHVQKMLVRKMLQGTTSRTLVAEWYLMAPSGEEAHARVESG